MKSKIKKNIFVNNEKISIKKNKNSIYKDKTKFKPLNVIKKNIFCDIKKNDTNVHRIKSKLVISKKIKNVKKYSPVINKKTSFKNVIKNNYFSKKLENENLNKRRQRNTIIKNIKLKNKSNFINKRILNNIDKNNIHIKKNNKYIKNKRSILQQHFIKPVKIFNRDILIGENISVAELANKMAVKSTLVIKKLMDMGTIATVNQILDQDTAQIVSEEMGHKVIIHYDNALEIELLKNRDTKNKNKKIRAPIVTVMGHVDHGKTSLLDYIRSTKITSHEFGGITQHIGAYNVITPNGNITFLDTPGHAAFTAMRARGAKITDIIVLVIAADDGIMPQTIEAIKHAQYAKVPIIVAINKIDKPGVNIDNITKELIKYSIISEKFGGENIFVSVSAKTGFGIDKLLMSILLQAEILELKSIYNCMASGTVIESFLDKGFGPVATVLINIGTLKKGDIVICGLEYGKVKCIRNEFRQEIKLAGPSMPVEVLGLSGIPITGDILTVVKSEKKAREVALYRQKKFREVKLSKNKNSNIDDLFSTINSVKKLYKLNIILKADVQGSLEAIQDSLKKLSNESIKINIITSGIGAITETDAILSANSSAIILGFNVRADCLAKRIIDVERLNLRYYSIIYNLIDDVKKYMLGILKPKHEHNIIGLAEVRNIFKSPKFGLVVGCMVIEGIIKRNNPIRILRNNTVIYEGELESLRRFKEDVNEVRNGAECGIGIKNYNNIHIGDVIEVFQVLSK